jgi:uncharacterized membrane protein YkvA (DUF1232 family)
VSRRTLPDEAAPGNALTPRRYLVPMHTWLLALGTAVAIYVLFVTALFLAGRRVAAKEIANLIPNFLVLFKGLAQDPRVARRDKWLLAFGAAWVASPIDLLPEFIPVLGPLDDAVVVALILRHILKDAGEDVARDHWRGDPATLDKLLRAMAVRYKRGNG